MKGTVLIVDDEPYVRDSLARVLRRDGFTVRTAEDAASALDTRAFEGADVVITDLRMPGLDGLQLLQRIRGHEPDLPVIVLTGHGSVLTAVECLKAGAYDFLQKPADPFAVAVLVERAILDARRARELEYLRGRGPAQTDEDPIGSSPGWKLSLEHAETVAATDSSVLLLGESGTGKEEVAKFIHRRSPRRDGPFVRVNCATIPPELFESEFFGHRKGAFTGALSDRDGRFRVAHGGTLFMDEIGCMPDASQAKVLRVLQDGAFERIGETQPTTVDVRLIAATNSDLESAMEAGRFRRDLYYRIAVMVISLPPLRDRVQDIDPLADRFLGEFARRFQKPVRYIEPETRDLLRAYRWPGNIRELRNVIERAVLLERGETLGPSSVPANLRGTVPPPSRADSLNLREAIGRAERQTLEQALERAGGVKREAARLLGIDERNLGYFLKKHGLARSKREG